MDLAEIARAHPGWFRLWVVASLVWVAAAIIAQWDDVFPASPVRTSGTPGITSPDIEFHRACDARFGVHCRTQAGVAQTEALSDHSIASDLGPPRGCRGGSNQSMG